MGIACSLLPLHSSKSACMQGNGIMLYSASTLLDRLAVCCQPGDLCSHVLSPEPLGHPGLQHPPPMAPYFLADDPQPGLRALDLKSTRLNSSHHIISYPALSFKIHPFHLTPLQRSTSPV